MAKFDIGTFSDAYAKGNEEGREVDLKNPDTGISVGITLRIAGPYSKRQEEAQQALGDWTRENAHATKEQSEAALLHRFASGVISWSWADGVEFRGSVPECTIDNVKRVMTECRWFYDQLVGATNVSRGFIKG